MPSATTSTSSGGGGGGGGGEGVGESTAAAASLSFGKVLDEASQGILLQFITHMSVFASSEGLFRKSGNKGRMEQMVRETEAGNFGSVLLNTTFNAHDFASVLKQYFSELPEPLLLKRHLNAYLQAASNACAILSSY